LKEKSFFYTLERRKTFSGLHDTQKSCSVFKVELNGCLNYFKGLLSRVRPSHNESAFSSIKLARRKHFVIFFGGSFHEPRETEQEKARGENFCRYRLFYFSLSLIAAFSPTESLGSLPKAFVGKDVN
jgi:hypothetical protein